MSNNQSAIVTVGWVDLLGVVLVILKLLGKINLTWGWVLAPFWVPLVLVVGFVGIAAIVMLVTEAL